MKSSIQTLGAAVSLLAAASCSQIDGQDDDASQGDDGDGVVHDIVFYADGADEALLIGTYHSEAKTVTTSFGAEELYGLSVATGQESLFLVNASDGPALETAQLPVGEPLEAEGYVRADDLQAEIIPGVIEVDLEASGDGESLDAAGGCRISRSICSNRCSAWACGPLACSRVCSKRIRRRYDCTDGRSWWSWSRRAC